MRKAISAIILCFALTAIILICTIPAYAENNMYLGDQADLVTTKACFEDKLGLNTSHAGDKINIGGMEFYKGIGLHCNPEGSETYVEFDISGLKYQYFSAFVGIQFISTDNAFLDWGSVSFHIYGDGQELASTDVCNYGDKPVSISCDISGVSILRLVQDCNGDYSCDWGVWGDAKLTNTNPEEGKQEPTFNMDKTELITPADIVSGDSVYISDMYWVDNSSYIATQIMRDANTANEWIFDSSFRVFEKGLGMHGSSDDYTTYVKVNISDMGFTKFASFYGVCETMSQHDISMACCKFAVIGDGRMLFESDAMSYGEPMIYMECDITGISELTVAVAGAPDFSGTWGTWGGAVLSKSGNVKALFEEAAVVPEENKYSTLAEVIALIGAAALVVCALCVRKGNKKNEE